jgi:hypothetical protein
MTPILHPLDAAGSASAEGDQDDRHRGRRQPEQLPGQGPLVQDGHRQQHRESRDRLVTTATTDSIPACVAR